MDGPTVAVAPTAPILHPSLAALASAVALASGSSSRSLTRPRTRFLRDVRPGYIPQSKRTVLASLLPREWHDPFLLFLMDQPVSHEMIAYLASLTHAVLGISSTSKLYFPLETKVPSLEQFITGVCHYSRVCTPTLICAAIYLHRLRLKLPPNSSAGTAVTPHRIFLATLIIAAKYVNDSSPWNKHWVTFTSTLFDQEEVNLMEKQLLFVLDFDLSFEEREASLHFQPFIDQSVQAAQNRAKGRADILKATASAQSRASIEAEKNDRSIRAAALKRVTRGSNERIQKLMKEASSGSVTASSSMPIKPPVPSRHPLSLLPSRGPSTDSVDSSMTAYSSSSSNAGLTESSTSSSSSISSTSSSGDESDITDYHNDDDYEGDEDGFIRVHPVLRQADTSRASLLLNDIDDMIQEVTAFRIDDSASSHQRPKKSYGDLNGTSHAPRPQGPAPTLAQPRRATTTPGSSSPSLSTENNKRAASAYAWASSTATITANSYAPSKCTSVSHDLSARTAPNSHGTHYAYYSSQGSASSRPPLPPRPARFLRPTRTRKLLARKFSGMGVPIAAPAPAPADDFVASVPAPVENAAKTNSGPGFFGRILGRR